MDNLPAWITIKESPTFPKWKIVDVKYIATDNPCNNGSTNAYCKTLDKNGAYQAGVKVWQQWPSDRASVYMALLMNALDYCNQKFGASFFMSGDSSFDPAKGQSGPYSFYVDGNSDTVFGLGLPLKRHVQFLLTWQWVDSPTPPPAQGHWELVDATNRDNPQLKWVNA